MILDEKLENEQEENENARPLRFGPQWRLRSPDFFAKPSFLSEQETSVEGFEV